ncbi:TlpA family protein disulfide reductase [Stutzerimonas tarimensis]|uniref:TlpA family protein disulfide reductase n=1 Tax=Stutzerimonas tarimensis TaxID=1507735 RepID=A0ABV7T9G4_9GAMM
MKAWWLVLGMLLAGCSESWGPDQAGQEVSSADLEGRWLLINYWAEWCAPCRVEIPELNALAQSRSDLVVLGVNFDALQGEALGEAAKALDIRFRVLARDPAERLGIDRPPVLPSSYLVDPQGVVRATLVGEQTAASIEQRLATLR